MQAGVWQQAPAFVFVSRTTDLKMIRSLKTFNIQHLTSNSEGWRGRQLLERWALNVEY
jgi:hypothetical protein